MKRLLGAGLLAAGLALGACAEDRDGEAAERDLENRTPHEEQFVTADTSAGYDTNAPAPVAPVQGSGTPANPAFTGPLTATGNLVGVAENAPPGTVTVTEAGPGTQVLLKIDRYTPGTELVATLTRGDCRQPGQRLARIGEPFTVSQQGFATHTASIPYRARDLMNGAHSVRINTPGQNAPEFVLACADLPAVDPPA